LREGQPENQLVEEKKEKSGVGWDLAGRSTPAMRRGKPQGHGEGASAGPGRKEHKGGTERKVLRG